MAAKLEWDGDVLMRMDGFARIVGQVRTRADGLEYDYVTRCPDKAVSEPYPRKNDARRDLESEVRRRLKEAGVEVQ